MPTTFRRLCLAALFFSSALLSSLSAQSPTSITVNTRDAGTPFPHFWEQIFGSGRAVLSLRQSYRDDLRTVKSVTDFQAVRFHGIFMDDVGLYDPNAQTQNPGQAAQVEHRVGQHGRVAGAETGICGSSVLLRQAKNW